MLKIVEMMRQICPFHASFLQSGYTYFENLAANLERVFDHFVNT